MKINIKDSILLKLILLIVVVILIPLLFWSSTSYSTYKESIEKKIISTNIDTLKQVDQNLSKVTDQINSIINEYNNNSVAENFLTQNYDSEYSRIKNTKVFENDISRYVASLNWINCDVILLGANGDFFTTSNNSPRLSSSSIHNSYWFKEAIINSDEISWFIFDRSYFTQNRNEAVIVATKPLINNSTNSIYGTIIIEVSEKYFFDVYKDVVNNNENLFICNGDGNIISSSDRNISLSLDPTEAFIPMENENLLYNYTFNNTDYIYISHNSSVSDWTIIKLIPRSNLEEEINVLKRSLIFSALFCILLIIIGVIITAIKIYKPLQDLLLKMKLKFINKEISTYETKTPTFTDVVTGYEQLISEVDNTIDLLILENENRRKAELHALEMQINPHFLYNTLNSIKCLVWTKQYSLIEPTITSLVKLLQQTLRNIDELITLEEELNNVKNYLYIQNIRTCNSITVNYNIRNTFNSTKIPCLVLQPIIENAIFHGIEPLGKPGVITISAYKKDNDLYIEVIDNGVGMNNETVDKLLNNSIKDKKSGFNNIGIGNVNDRLKMYYGGNYGLRIESKIGLGTSVTLKIKL